VAAARSAAQASALAASPLLGLLTPREADGAIDFALGSPGTLTDLPAELFTLPAAQHAAMQHDRQYHPMGITPLREAVAAYYTAQGLPSTAPEILITNGAQHGIALAAGLYVQRGDSVLVEDPAYFGALDAFQAAGARIGSLPVGSTGVSPAILRDRIAATAARLVYLTPTFQNPTGAVMPRGARKEIARIAAEFAVPVIDDGTLAEMALDSAPPPPIAAHDPSGPVLTIASVSKLMWAGLRVGWIRAPQPVIARLARLKSATDLASPPMTQAIAARLMTAVADARRLRRTSLKPRLDLLVSLLREHLPQWTFRVPTGGLFLWVKLPGAETRAFAQTALRHGVLIIPGPTMSASGAQNDHIRVPFLAEPDVLREGVRRLAAAWREYAASARHHSAAANPIV
jgi:DNA-binding transcriptional MocR family regulator